MILIIPHGFEPNYTVGLVRGLKANGVDPHVITSDEDHARLVALGAACTNLRGAVSPQRPRLRKLGDLVRYYIRLTCFVMRSRPDVLHFTGTFRNELVWFDALYLPVIFRLSARRYVYTVHNVLPHGRTHSPLFHLAYRLAYCVPHILLLHTRRSMEQLRDRFGVPDAKLRLTSIGLNEDVPTTGLTRLAARSRLGLDLTAHVVLFFGRIDYYKGLDLLLSAVERVSVRGLTLVIAGSFVSPSQRDAIVAGVARLRPRLSVMLHDDGVSNESIEAYFRSADLVVLPYREVTQSGVLFLALAFGVPVLVSDVGGLPEYVDAEIGIVTPAGDVPRLAAAIEQFFAHDQAFDRVRIAARAATYRWTNVAASIAAIYREGSKSRP